MKGFWNTQPTNGQQNQERKKPQKTINLRGFYYLYLGLKHKDMANIDKNYDKNAPRPWRLLTKKQKLQRAVDRFNRLVYPEPNTGCWLWAGTISFHGYAIIGIGANNTTRANRFSYILHKGKIPKGLLVCHTCDNRWCVNPDHLFLGTHKDNIDDMDKKGRRVTLIGEDAPNAKLNNNKVITIKTSILTNRQLAKHLGVNHATVWAVRNNIRWIHVQVNQT